MTDIENVIVAGGWKCLCAGVMLQAVERLMGSRARGPRSKHPRRRIGNVCRDGATQLQAASDWIGGGVGLITFEDCCESIGVSPERARRIINAQTADTEQS